MISSRTSLRDLPSIQRLSLVRLERLLYVIPLGTVDDAGIFMGILVEQRLRGIRTDKQSQAIDGLQDSRTHVVIGDYEKSSGESPVHSLRKYAFFRDSSLTTRQLPRGCGRQRPSRRLCTNFIHRTGLQCAGNARTRSFGTFLWHRGREIVEIREDPARSLRLRREDRVV